MSSSRPPWAADFDLDASDIPALVAEIAPDLAGVPHRVLGEGWDYRAIEVGGEILRIAKRAEVADSLPTEVRLLEALASRLPLDIPRLTGHAGTPGAPHGFTRHARLAGRPLSGLAVPTSQLRWIASRLGEFLAVLHAMPPAMATEAGVPSVSWDEPAASGRRSLARLRALGLVPREVVLRAERVVSEPPPAGAGTGVLVHSDLWPEHLLVDDVSLELTGIIDWGDAEMGDPAADHAAAWFLGGDEALAACMRSAGVPWSETFAARARFHGVHHAIGDAWYAKERGLSEYGTWAVRALSRLP